MKHLGPDRLDVIKQHMDGRGKVGGLNLCGFLNSH